MWLEICWGSLWIIYIGVKLLAYISDWLIQHFWEWKYHILVHCLKWPITLLLLAITAFGSVPRICYSDHQLCNEASWIGILQATLRATIIIATIILIVELVLQMILIKNISQFLVPRRKRILWEIAILLNLIKKEERGKCVPSTPCPKTIDQSNPEVIHYEDWTNIVIDSATEISEKTPATKEQQSKFFKRELDWILCIHEGEGDINKDTLHNFIKDLIHRFVDCDRGITDAERVVRALRHISVGLSLIGAAVIYGRLL